MEECPIPAMTAKVEDLVPPSSTTWNTITDHSMWKMHTSPPKQKLIDWDNLAEDGCRAWLLPISGTHKFAGSNNKFLFEELQIYDNAHMAILTPNETKDAIGMVSGSNNELLKVPMEVVSAPILHFLYMIGDRTGAVHLDNRQEMDLERDDIDLPFSVYVYQGAHLGLAPRTVVHGVEIYNAGALSHIQNLTLHHGGYIWLQHGGHTAGEPESHYQFQTVRVQDSAWVNAVTDPITEPGITFITDEFFIEGGGRMQGTRITIISINITIDSAGLLSTDGTGYEWHHDNETHGRDSLHGSVNPGKPPDTYGIRAGGSHGGTGGRGPSDTNGKTGLPYGDLYEPYVFGSSGGAGPNNQPGSFWWRHHLDERYRCVMIHHLQSICQISHTYSILILKLSHTIPDCFIVLMIKVSGCPSCIAKTVRLFIL